MSREREKLSPRRDGRSALCLGLREDFERAVVASEFAKRWTRERKRRKINFTNDM